MTQPAKRGRPRKTAEQLAASGSWRAKVRRAEERAFAWVPPKETDGLLLDSEPMVVYHAAAPAVLTLGASNRGPERCTVTIDGTETTLEPGEIKRLLFRVPLAAGATVTAKATNDETIVFGFVN